MKMNRSVSSSRNWLNGDQKLGLMKSVFWFCLNFADNFCFKSQLKKLNNLKYCVEYFQNSNHIAENISPMRLAINSILYSIDWS